MSWISDLFSWRSGAPTMPPVLSVLPEQELPKLFRKDSFENEMTGLGGPNDMAMASRIRRQHGLSVGELESLYRSNGYVKRFIDIVPDQATRKGWQIIQRSAEEGGKDERIIEDEDKRLRINSVMGDALRWARLYGGSLVLIVNGDADLSEPMNEDHPGEIVNLVVFDRNEFSALAWNNSIGSAHFREVETWSLTPVVTSADLRGGVVHRSRVIYIPGTKVPPSRKIERNGFDDSVLEAPYDQFVSKTVLDQQMARLSHDSRVRVLKLRGLTGQGLGDAKEALLARAKLWAQTVGLVGIGMLLEGEEFVSTTDNVSGWGQLDDKARQALSAVTGIPQTLLFGDSPSGLNTDGQSGRNNFADVIAGIQNHLLRPHLERLYKILIAAGDSNGSDWSLEFNPIFEITEQETATLRKTYAETDALYIDRGVLSPDDVAESRFSVRGWEADIRAVDADGVADREAMIEAETEAPETEEPEAKTEEPTEAVAGAGKPPDENVQATALNGAQQAAAQSWITLYTSGQIPRKTAVSALVNMSGMDLVVAEAMVPPADFTPRAEPASEPAPDAV